MHFVDAQVALNQNYAFGFARGDLTVLPPDASIKRVVLLLKAAFILAGLLGNPAAPPPGPGEAELERWQQQQGQIRLKIAADKT